MTGTPRIKEVREGKGTELPPDNELNALFMQFALSLAELSREKTGELMPHVTDHRLVKIFCRITGHEMLAAMSNALWHAPQGIVTPELYATIVKHQGLFSQAANADELYPDDPTQEEQFAKQVRVFRALFPSTTRR